MHHLQHGAPTGFYPDLNAAAATCEAESVAFPMKILQYQHPALILRRSNTTGDRQTPCTRVFRPSEVRFGTLLSDLIRFISVSQLETGPKNSL